jgi:hypothetical protein
MLTKAKERKSNQDGHIDDEFLHMTCDTLDRCASELFGILPGGFPFPRYKSHFFT